MTWKRPTVFTPAAAGLLREGVFPAGVGGTREPAAAGHTHWPPLVSFVCLHKFLLFLSQREGPALTSPGQVTRAGPGQAAVCGGVAPVPKTGPSVPSQLGTLPEGSEPTTNLLPSPVPVRSQGPCPPADPSLEVQLRDCGPP